VAGQIVRAKSLRELRQLGQQGRFVRICDKLDVREFEGGQRPGDTVQRPAQHRVIKKQQRAEGLVLGGGRDFVVDGERRQERGDLGGAHLSRVALAVEEDVPLDPMDVRLLGATAVGSGAGVLSGPRYNPPARDLPPGGSTNITLRLSWDKADASPLRLFGTHEMDASIMDGKTLKAGAVGSVQHVKNPINLARLVMEKSPHVMLDCAGAETFAEANGIELVDQKYFFTQDRWDALQKMKAAEKNKGSGAGKPFRPRPRWRSGGQ